MRPRLVDHSLFPPKKMIKPRNRAIPISNTPERWARSKYRIHSNKSSWLNKSTILAILVLFLMGFLLYLKWKGRKNVQQERDKTKKILEEIQNYSSK